MSWFPSIWGRKAFQGALVWESGQPWLHTPSGRILLAISAEVQLPALAPSIPAGRSSHPVPAGPEVIVVGKRSLKGGQLVVAVGYLMALARRSL